MNSDDDGSTAIRMDPDSDINFEIKSLYCLFSSVIAQGNIR